MTLANRLCSFFLVAVALLLAGFSAVVYLLIGLDLSGDLDERLAGVIEQMGAEVIDYPHRVEWKAGVWRPVPDPETDAGVWRSVPNWEFKDVAVEWTVFAPSGRALERSGGFPVGEDARVVRLVPESGHRHATLVGRDGQRWRLTLRRKRAASAIVPASDHPRDDREANEDSEAPLRGGPPLGEPSLILVTAAPLEPLEATLAGVALLLAGSSLAVWLLAWVLGREACRRSLRPMTRMSDAARVMSPLDRGQHLPSPGTHDELEALAGAFNGLLDRLHDALERQDRFAGDASHQLRTPLAALIGEVEVARRRDRSADDYRRVLDDVHEEALRLRQIVESLLFLARGDEARPGLQAVDLADWVVAHLAARRRDDRTDDLRAEVATGGTLAVGVHPPLLGELLDNLLDNAAKYSGPGTPIVVRLRREAAEVILVVEDRGCGLGPEDLPHLFEPFYRSVQARKLGLPGVGLGLSVVARIVAAFGGTISAEGEPGRGARFIVRLPGVR